MYYDTNVTATPPKCPSYYDMVGLDSEALCANSTFNFTDSYETAFALTNLYLFKQDFNPTYYNQFMNITHYT